MSEPASPQSSPPPAEEKAAQSASAAAAATLESVKEAAAQTRGAINEGLHYVARSLLQGAAITQATVQEGYNTSIGILDEGKVHVDTGVAHYKALEVEAVSYVKGGIEWGLANPYIAYPALGLGTLLILPMTRRLLYHQTIGRFRSAEGIQQASEAKIAGFRTKLEDFSKEGQKLQERMMIAEEEFKRGMSKLKATRQEMQRLAAVVSKSERSLTGVLHELRTIKKLDSVTALRAEAASQVAALKLQQAQLNKSIYRIASQDI